MKCSDEQCKNASNENVDMDGPLNTASAQTLSKPISLSKPKMHSMKVLIGFVSKL